VSMRDVTLEKNLHVKYRKELDNKEVVIRDLQDARAALEEYSHGLESKVQERTVELRTTNSLLKTILDSLGQGILVFDKDGNCLPIYSQVCRKLLNGEPPGRAIEDVLGLGAKLSADFQAWRNVVFDGALDFDDLVPLAPSGFQNSTGLEIKLDYNPMLNAGNQLDGIVVVTTDKTLEMAALRKAEEERQLVNKVTQVARNRAAFRLFISDARRRLLALASSAPMSADEVSRDLHTIKGGSSSFSLQDLTKVCHEVESELTIVSISAKAPELSALLEKEILALEEILGPLEGDTEISSSGWSVEKIQDWGSKILAAGDLKTSQEIGRAILRACREKPLSTSVGHLEPSLKDLASSYGKILDHMTVEGGEINVDSEFFEPLLSSLIHSFRNSVYHGLETPEERRLSGKPEGGSIAIRFGKEVLPNGVEWMKIEIQDDGRGVNPERIRKKLLSSGRGDLVAGSDEEVIQAIFLDDFSTAEQVDMIAGRGVGMAAIAGEARRIGGTVLVQSVVGQGMKLLIRVPVPKPESDVHAIDPARAA
jgi:two-component system, chemotaxis family, sensor kinase CheA